MKKFRFRLEALYRFRREMERQALQELEGVKMEELKLRETLLQLQGEQREWSDAYNSSASSNKKDWILWIEKYLVDLEKKHAALEQELVKVRERLRVVLKKVEESYRSRRQVEIMKEKEFTLFCEMIRKKEQNDSAELGLLRFTNVSGISTQ